MIVNLPIYIHKVPKRGGGGDSHLARPLFIADEQERRDDLVRVLAALKRRLQRRLAAMAREPHHRALLQEIQAHELQEHPLDLAIPLRCGTLKLKGLLVSTRRNGIRSGFLPAWQDLWFTLPSDGSVHDRCAEVLTRHYRAEEKKHRHPHPTMFEIEGREWLTWMQISINTKDQQIPKEKSLRMFLGQEEQVDGALELMKVGRCLDWQLNEQETALFRDNELAEMRRIGQDSQPRPVLVVGPSGVGKTALIKNWVLRTHKERADKSREETWLLSPQRLISGMSYVGEWENRVHAIIEHAKKKNHFLYFDDLLGLFRAGMSASSDLTVAQVLKPFIERRQVRVIGEITPAALSRLREQDRGFADMFHIIRLAEPEPRANIRMLHHMMRLLEAEHRCEFQRDALPQVLDLTGRFVQDQVFPGKAVTLLRQLAARHENGTIDGEKVRTSFQAKSGFSLEFLNREQSLSREAVMRELTGAVHGQPAAITALTDVILAAKARLNDPHRPYGTLLFLGPTGVGKTLLAKTVAAFLYGSSERLLRFDMNEYLEADAALRLIGSFAQPNGLLTHAVSHHPFSVLLFDEIEKAHPVVYDLLLQVLGEGRLSDGNGRTVDFSHTIIIMTSNLGAREAGSSLGLTQDPTDAREVYRRAARQFFRPEFFNRIDHLIPFNALTRDHISRIAEGHVRDLLEREGLRRRGCAITVEPRWIARIGEAGYHPELGARALKRAVERHLTVPLGRALSGRRQDEPVFIRVAGDHDGRPNLQVFHYRPAARVPERRQGLDPEKALERLEAELIESERHLQELAPAGDVSIDALSPELTFYFALRHHQELCRERLHSVRDLLESLTLSHTSTRRIALERPIPIDDSLPVQLPPDWDPADLLRTANVTHALKALAKSHRGIDDPVGFRLRTRLRKAWEAVDLLRILVDAGPSRVDDQAALICVPLTGAVHEPTRRRLPDYGSVLELFPGITKLEGSFDAEHRADMSCTLFQGPIAGRLLELEAGVHLGIGPDGLVPYLVAAQPIGDDPETWYHSTWKKSELEVRERAWYLAEALAGAGTLPPIVRVISDAAIVDLPSGLLSTDRNPAPNFYFRTMLHRLTAGGAERPDSNSRPGRREAP
ncbi:ATP-dependent Clp protease ATP-binding subunit [Sulfidibacter corallicola]|uniref:ATP-dependent Clp protease ATP-binding subunit n=1 Tax=Sulfidibacter corallicola TaxID=2818388 RepID=A0A8A4TWH0_SULCO|nr:AAA family ATPase [Sulfidibacter corallicola]QTD50865.1 ATP-dependent Clp protease ATP-binding subunit [Sulfidibacter corallicola]